MSDHLAECKFAGTRPMSLQAVGAKRNGRRSPHGSNMLTMVVFMRGLRSFSKLIP